MEQQNQPVELKQSDISKLIEQHERYLTIGERAERAFFGVAAPYYISQYLTHAFGEKYLEAHPIVDHTIYAFSAGVGAFMALPKVRAKFVSAAKNVAGRTQKASQKTLETSAARYLEASLNVYFGFKKAGEAITTRAQKAPARVAAIKKTIAQKLAR